MTYNERLEKIDSFKNYIEQSRINLLPNCLEVIDYLIENLAQLPLTTLPPYENSFLESISSLLAKPENWNLFDERILDVITSTHYWKNGLGGHQELFYRAYFEEYLKNIRKYDTIDSFNIAINKTIQYWKKRGLDENDLIEGFTMYLTTELQQPSIAEFIFSKTLIALDSTFISCRNNHCKSLLLEILFIREYHLNDELALKFIFEQPDNDIYFIDTDSIDVLLKYNSQHYISLIEKHLHRINNPVQFNYVINCLPTKRTNNDIVFEFLAKAKYSLDSSYTEVRYNVDLLSIPEIIAKKDFFFEIFEYCRYPQVKCYFFEKLFPIFGEEMYPYIFSNNSFIEINSNYSIAKIYYELLLKYIPSIYFEPFDDKFLNTLKNSWKPARETAVSLIIQLGERILPKVKEVLFMSKNIQSRQSAALILSLMKTGSAQEILINAIDSEKNDDTRDTMLEAVSGLLPIPNTQELILQNVKKAKERGKLDNPLTQWLDESKLSPIFWNNSNQIIDIDTIRFLFYRMNRAKDIRTDIEAKPLIMLIDRASSTIFAKDLLKMYFENGADAKLKFCLTLGGLLGDETVIVMLSKKVDEFAAGSRGKMAEYIVKSLALQGSTKALRAVEFYSRKYKNKNKNIGSAAIDSFAIAADELGITPYDLADDIIPNFDFDGLFREFKVGDDSYRAFINTDFKMAFLNEDNKLLKSLPKGVSKELADEFKEIGKEIKDLIKSQTSRLEQYLVIQRKWRAEKWKKLFLENPIMFAYTIRLVWGIYNDKNELIATFMCQQDQTLIDEGGNEFDITEGLHIGIVHSIDLTSEQIEYWNTFLYDAILQPIFLQLKRSVVLLKTSDENMKKSDEFRGIKMSGYTYTSKMEKLGWFRGSVVDAGGISSYFKDFSELGITAISMQEGIIGIGYLEGDAEIGRLMFVEKGKVSFGSYQYNEPTDENDSRLIVFKDLPKIVYSEVMADMLALKAIAK